MVWVKHVGPECKGKKLVFNRSKAELYCSKCGFVLCDEEIDLGKDWRFQEDARAGPRKSGVILTQREALFRSRI